MTAGKIAVAIVEDNSELRDGLARLIAETAGYECVGSFGDCMQFLSGVRDIIPDVVLMDIGLPGMSGIEGVRKLKAMLPETEVMMLTVFEDEQKVFDSLCAGASGYMLKKTPPAKLLEAIRELRDGGVPMSARIARKVLAQFQGSGRPPDEASQISDRERDILSGLVRGLSYKMIADEYSISIDTVRSHVRHIYDKLHVNSKAQAVSLAMKNRLI